MQHHELNLDCNSLFNS